MKLSDSPLTGNVFLMNDGEFGDRSLHFNIECYLSLEHTRWSSLKFDDGTVFPSRIFFTEQSFDSERRKFCGIANFGGIFRGTISEKWEVIFDPKFLCIISGKIIYGTVDGIRICSHAIGKSYEVHYINADLDKTHSKKIAKRLNNEGAIEEPIDRFLDDSVDIIASKFNTNNTIFPRRLPTSISRMSFRSILIKKWKQISSITYEASKILTFRPDADFEDWAAELYLIRNKKGMLGLS